MVDGGGQGAEVEVIRLVLASLYLGDPPLPRRGWRLIRDALRRAAPSVEQAEAVLRRQGFLDAAALLSTPGRLASFEDRGFITSEDPWYPWRWEAALGDGAPPALWLKHHGVGDGGDGDGMPRPSWAVVGSRSPTSEGIERLRRALPGLGVTISGGACGVDASSGAEIVLLPHGLPSNSSLRGQHPAGTPPRWFVTTRPPGEEFSTGAAMERNRLLYLAAEATLVVQPRHRQGGTWHGAADALRLSRRCPYVPPIYLLIGEEPSLAERCLLQMGALPFAASVALPFVGSVALAGSVADALAGADDVLGSSALGSSDATGSSPAVRALPEAGTLAGHNASSMCGLGQGRLELP